MKTLQKILLILVVAICVSIVMPKNVSRAETVTQIVNSIKGGENVTGAGELGGVANKVLSFLQVASGIAAVIVIAVTGFRYIIETPEVKGELKKNMFPIIVGILLVFFAATIANFFIGIFAQSQ